MRNSHVSHPFSVKRLTQALRRPSTSPSLLPRTPSTPHAHHHVCYAENGKKPPVWDKEANDNEKQGQRSPSPSFIQPKCTNCGMLALPVSREKCWSFPPCTYSWRHYLVTCIPFPVAVNDELPSFRHKNTEKDTYIFGHRGVRHEIHLLAVKGLNSDVKFFLVAT